ncbi:MAG TPA: SDR family NAD(P)-dependent oxidoreductase [Solirubrobacterales bacterium]|nr:SDR family NAD(P)-dependent oxidoreductase [Solirubrobacterales bacterium]
MGRPPLEQAVVVVTGASSGIGRAASLRFARRGSRLVLMARGGEALEEVRSECERMGAPAVACRGDVRSEDDVERVAAEAQRRFGRIDVWVNNAGTMAYGEFWEIPSDIFRTVVETNLFGQVHGARAAIARFRRQDGGGVLINMSSVWGRITTPEVSPYVVSKQAVRAFSECLRHDLEGKPGIDVVTIIPQAVDTPIFEHAANVTGGSLRPIPPMYDVDTVAEGIVRCAESPKREVNYGRAGRALELLYALAPKLYCRVAPSMFLRGTFEDQPAEKQDGNVLHTIGPYREDGGWKAHGKPRLRRAVLAAGAGALGALVGRKSFRG